MPRGQLLKELAALTASGQDCTRDAEDDLYEDGTSAAAVQPGGCGHGDGEGVGAGEWRLEGGKGKELGAPVRSQLRAAAGMAALEEDERYLGKRASRKSLGWIDEDMEEESEAEDDSDKEKEEEEDEEKEEEDEDEEEEDETEEDESDDDEEEEAALDDGSAADDTEEEAGSSSQDDGSVEDGVGGDVTRLHKDKEGMALLLRRSRDEQRHKAEEAKRHRDLWNRLLEVRILLQRLLGMGNRLPRAEGGAFAAYRQADAGVGEGLDGAAGLLRGVLSQLVELRRAQASELEEDEEGEGKGSSSKRARVDGEEFTGPLGGRDDPWVATADDYAVCKAHWVRVLDAAHQRATLTGAVTRKFRVVNQGLWQQVEASLADRARALRRSHLTRAAVREAGAFGLLGQGAGEEEEPDEEAFDDAELYQLLLRDYIQSVGPGALGVDGVGGTAATLQQQLMGANKRKRGKRANVDAKASKGRKLRYAVHPKLEHFMFPIPPPKPPMDVDRLFASLPGSSSAAGAGVGVCVGGEGEE